MHWAGTGVRPDKAAKRIVSRSLFNTVFIINVTPVSLGSVQRKSPANSRAFLRSGTLSLEKSPDLPWAERKSISERLAKGREDATQK